MPEIEEREFDIDLSHKEIELVSSIRFDEFNASIKKVKPADEDKQLRVQLAQRFRVMR